MIATIRSNIFDIWPVEDLIMMTLGIVAIEFIALYIGKLDKNREIGRKRFLFLIFIIFLI